MDPRLRGDLEWIVARALEKEPGRRFSSVHELAEDLRAFLENRVVKAYRTGALIEARSCERFSRLLEVVEDDLAVRKTVTAGYGNRGMIEIISGSISEVRPSTAVETSSS